MGRFFRDIWTEVIAAGVLAAMSIIIGIIRDTDPIIIAVIAFVIILISFRVIFYFQEKKIKIRLNVEKERWNRVREERVKLRKQYSNRTVIPELLYQMSEKARILTENNLMELVMSDYDEDITNDFREILQIKDVKKIKLNRTDIVKVLTKFPSLRQYKSPIQQVRALAISFYQVLSSHGEGVMPLVERDTEYQRLNKEVEEYLIGLPQSIHFKKDAHIQLANAYYTITAIDFSKIEQPALVRLSQPLFKTAIESELSTIRADISSSIEKFLTGEDAK